MASNQPSPHLSITPEEFLEGSPLIVSGRGWPDCPVRFRIGKADASVVRIAKGFPGKDRTVRPAGDGEFVVELATRGLAAGKTRVTAEAEGASAHGDVRVLDRPEGNGPGLPKHVARAREFFDRRFGHIGFVPPGTRTTAIRDVRRLRGKTRRPPRPRPAGDDGVFGQPDPAACNWTPVGPAPVVANANTGESWSGRTLALAIHPTDSDTVYAGTAGGGVWKTTDGGDTWTPLTDFAGSLSIGAIAIDPSDPQTVLAGTGEYNNGYVGTYYGNGVFRTPDGGTTWMEHAAATFERDEISQIVFDPSDTTGQSVLLSSSIGIYHSPDGGVNWTQLEAGNFSGLVAFETGGNALKAIAARYGDGLYESTRTGTSWSAWTKITDAAMPTIAGLGRIAMAQRGPNSKNLTALFERASAFEAVVTTNNGGNSWSVVDVRLNRPLSVGTQQADGHGHSFTIPAADLTAAPAAKTYVTSSAGMPSHTHQVTLDADQVKRAAHGSLVIATTDADGTGHQHDVFFAGTGQGGYNLHVAPHPDDANTLFLGDVRLWRSTSGGGVFTQATGIHVDHHAFAFDPNDADTLWAASDGGVWRSTNGGASFQHRNRELATLMYIGLAQHPDWENVILAGTQDNGTHRYEGSPVWRLSVGGDGGHSGIDAGLPTRMYHTFFALQLQRSDSAGDPGTWTNKNGGLSGASQFYVPFVLDPSTPSTCYIGGNELFRSDDNADNWTAITSTIGENITAIAVHPADSDVVYAGTRSGKIYRVTNSGAWAPADIAIAEVSAPPYPEVFVSDLAVDPGGALWATLGAVLWTESSGEFSNAHVWRLQPTAGAMWEDRSGTLAQANPINAVVIDPANPSRLFVGGDIGVFRTDDAGGSWTAWDEGLPNAPVYRLGIHGPRRLLRAATHGRSIWERRIDAASCPTVDLYVRDNILDSGRVTPSPSHVPHPFDPTKGVRWWHSADIKVDSQDPDPFQTPAVVDDAVEFHVLEHRNPVRETVNRFSLQVHNRGVFPATNVRARAFFADASAGLPALPPDFWTAGRPFTGTPTTTDWTPVGTTQTIPTLAAGEPGVLTWEWTVPAGAAKHSCLLGVVTCDEDPIGAAGIFDLDALVPMHKHATLKNLHVVDPTAPAMGTSEGAWRIDFHNTGGRQRIYEVIVDWGGLPDRVSLFVAAEKLARLPWKPADIDKKDRRVKPIDGKEMLPGRIPDRCGGWRSFDLGGALQLRRPRSGETKLGGFIVPAGGKRALVLNLSRFRPRRDIEFSVMQGAGKAIVGGSTYAIRGPKAEE